MYRKDIDSYKGMAILAVIFFHLGYLKSGYLGVDLFFVINGFLVIPSIIKKISTGDFSYFDFLKKRLVRLYPLVIIATTICLLAGYVGMMPDNYENLAQAIVASNFMSENILSAITTHDYWNTVNDYNPLMHLWYIGILFEFYIIFPLILLLATKALPSKDKYETCKYTLLFLTLASVIYYLISKQEANSFYFIQYRFFEICIGGIAAYVDSVKLFKNSNLAMGGKIQLSLLLMLIFIQFSGLLTQKYETLGCNPRIIGYEADVANEGLLLPKPIMLFATVLLSAFIVPVRNENRFLAMPLLSTLGRMSYSLFIWHQLILAFMRYFIDIRFNALTMAVYVALVCGLTWLTYNYVEQRRVNTNRTLTSCIIIALFTTGCSLYIYFHAGVVRDVPELDIEKSNVHRGMHGEYCDRVYDYKDDFPDNGKINILCVGNSYARDMGNILLESEYSNDINLSYVTTPNDKDIERINKAQIVMIFGQKDAKVNDIVWRNVNDSCKVMGIGTKHFGVCNGNHYVHRIDADYHQRKANLDSRYRDINNMWMSEYGKENYIDIIGANSTEDGRMYLFTDEGKLISQDCYHLTQAGAKWFAKRLNLKEILNIEE